MDKLDQILKEIQDIKLSQAGMEVDVRHHIKRTDKLETKVNYIWYLVLLGAGAGMIELAPFLKTILGG